MCCRILYIYPPKEHTEGRTTAIGKPNLLLMSMYVRSPRKIICVLVVWELRALYRGNMDQLPARMVRNPIFNDRTEGNSRQEQGSVSTIPSFAELKKKEIRSSTPDISAENSHQFWLGSDIEPSASNTDLNASATTRNNATGNPVRVPPRTASAHCRVPRIAAHVVHTYHAGTATKWDMWGLIARC